MTPGPIDRLRLDHGALRSVRLGAAPSRPRDSREFLQSLASHGVEHLLAALRALGFGSPKLAEADLVAADQVIRLGVPPRASTC